MKPSLNHVKQYQKASLVLALFTGLFLLPFSANADIFMKIDGLDGEATDANHEQWIDILSVSESLHAPEIASTDGSRRRGAVVFEDVVVAKVLDKTSPKLREALAQGKVYPQIEIEITRNCGSGQVTIFKYDFKNPSLTSVSLQGTDSDALPVEMLSLNFEEIKWTYTELDGTCAKQGDVEATWKVEEGTL
jgi:type VI secretion system secreted protein Hcp